MHKSCKTWKMIFWIFRNLRSTSKSWNKFHSLSSIYSCLIDLISSTGKEWGKIWKDLINIWKLGVRLILAKLVMAQLFLDESIMAEVLIILSSTKINKQAYLTNHESISSSFQFLIAKLLLVLNWYLDGALQSNLIRSIENLNPLVVCSYNSGELLENLFEIQSVAFT